MKALIQRVRRAEVRVDGESVGRIGLGYLVLLGVADGDSEDDARRLARKTSVLRLFPSENKPIDRSITDVSGAALVVSQFTLCGDVRKGNRPSFVAAAEPPVAEALYERYCASLRDEGVAVETGRFAAMMDVELVNDGPVTILIDTADLKGPRADVNAPRRP
ncbi:MAG: D-aminoacyl-tRNA deacylase [Planctomycetota bacterium]|jgi:D-tyrosyl-tRNA(Tyr) deacylase